MKRIIAVILAMSFVFCLCSCGQEKKEKRDEGIVTKIKAGQMTGTKFSLGTDPAVIKNAYSGSDKDENALSISEGQSTVNMVTDNYDYHYYKKNEKNGISVIVNFGDAYGFENGIAMSQDVIDKLGDDFSFKDATEDQMYFLRSEAQNCQVLRYTFSNKRVDFYFIDSLLAATVLCNTQYWED